MLYIPDRGDIVWMSFDPQVGREHAKHRPALVLSKKIYNSPAGLCVVCPISSKKKGYPFEVDIITNKINGVVLADQIKSFDWRMRNAKLIDKATNIILLEVQKKISPLIFNL